MRLAVLLAALLAGPSHGVERVIFDTDMLDDYDDVGALALLHRLADRGEAEILATTTCTRGNASVAMVEVVNAYYGRPDVPVGCVAEGGFAGRGGAWSQARHRVFEETADAYRPWVRHADSSAAPDALKVWRRALADAGDGSVVICTAGYTTNVRRLLESGADDCSPLDGVELARRKVKRWVAMAGWYPVGKETNARVDARSSEIAFAKWPGEIVFADFQYGRDVYCGRGVAESPAVHSPVKDVFARLLPTREAVRSGKEKWDLSEKGHSSWDEVAVLAAVRGTDLYFNLEHGRYRMKPGSEENEWVADASRSGGRLTVKLPKEEVGDLMDRLIAELPTARPSCKWLYPQMEMELYRVHEMRDTVRRMGMYAAHPGVLPESRETSSFRRRCAKEFPLPEIWGCLVSTRYDESEGMRYLSVCGGFGVCGAIRSSEAGWEARMRDGAWRPVAAYPDAEVPPHRERLPEDRTFSGLVRTNGWYDAGEELLAHVECVSDRQPHLFVGESVQEAMCEDQSLMEYDPTMTCVADGRWRTHLPLAFRYVRFREQVREVKVVPVGRNRPVLGGLVTDNARWRQMHEVGVRTLARCADDFLIDGIKRDRLPWAGDLAVSLLADAYVYGDAEIARRSLSVLDAYEGDVNGAVTYSMWTIVAHDLHQLYFGDRRFLSDRWWRIKWRIENLLSRTDSDGLVVRDVDWAFVDWAAPQSSTAMHAIWYGTLRAAARLADRVGDDCAGRYRAKAETVRAALERRAWDETRGLYCANPDDRKVFGRQANVYAVVFGLADDVRSRRIGDELAADRLPPVGTPYVFGWELVALCRTGHHREFFRGMERVFGTMLDAGATTYWEAYRAHEKGNARYSFYGRPWGRSLCHVWSAWPAFIFVSEALGIRPVSDGWKTWERKPIPGVEHMGAKIPTPHGILTF